MMRERISLVAESGQTMAEYAFVLSVIILAVITSLSLFSDAVAAGLGTVADTIKSVT
jgi:Flp pilus assembly pilin Flp